MSKIREVKGDDGGKSVLAFSDDDHNPVDESEATNVYITEMDKDGKTISTNWGTVKPKGKQVSEPTTNTEELVTNAISSHNKDPWYIDLLSAALDRDDVPTVNDAILLANRSYEETPTSPVVNLDDDIEWGDSGDNEGEEDGEDNGGESGQADEGSTDEEVENELALAINEAAQTKFVYNDNDDDGDEDDEEVENEDEGGGISQDYGEDDDFDED